MSYRRPMESSTRRCSSSVRENRVTGREIRVNLQAVLEQIDHADKRGQPGGDNPHRLPHVQKQRQQNSGTNGTLERQLSCKPEAWEAYQAALEELRGGGGAVASVTVVGLGCGQCETVQIEVSGKCVSGFSSCALQSTNCYNTVTLASKTIFSWLLPQAAICTSDSEWYQGMGCFTRTTWLPRSFLSWPTCHPPVLDTYLGHCYATTVISNTSNVHTGLILHVIRIGLEYESEEVVDWRTKDERGKARKKSDCCLWIPPSLLPSSVCFWGRGQTLMSHL